MQSTYQGQFGEFTIDDRDRQGVIVYRSGLMISAIAFAASSAIVLVGGDFAWITPLYGLFWSALGVSLWTIHIYLAPLHRALQLFWAIGGAVTLWIGLHETGSIAQFVYQHPTWIFGVGFVFAALTGIFFKEAFCFNRFETKLLTPIVPVLLLGHLTGWLSIFAEQILLGSWAILFLVFAVRKAIQPIPPDIGDKSVFEYLAKKH